MNPIEVVVKSSGKCVGYVCDACGSFYPAHAYMTPEAAVAESIKQADACCKPKVCGTCQGPNARQYGRGVGTNYSVEFLCDACRDKVWTKEREERQAKAFEKAQKALSSEYDKPVFLPGSDEGFFMSVDDLTERFEDDGEELPTFVWGSREKPLTLDADGIVESALEDHHEGALVKPSAIEKLQAMLYEWCAEQKVLSYEEDQTVAVILRIGDI